MFFRLLISEPETNKKNMPYEGGDTASGKKLFVGNLPQDISSKEIDDIFFKFGKIIEIEVKRDAKKPFAFVEFADDRDCEDAVKSRNNYRQNKKILQFRPIFTIFITFSKFKVDSGFISLTFEINSIFYSHCKTTTDSA